LSRTVRILGRSVPLPAAIATGVLVLGAGVALAAVLLTTTISGKATVKTIGTSNSISVTASAANGSALDCSSLSVSRDFTTLSFNPVLTKTVNGSNSGTTPVTGGDCTITLNVTNTGTSTIQLDGTSAFTVPDGWSVTPLSGNALSPILPGASASVSAKLTATQAAADGGTFGGKLVYTDATS
jgi:NPCBM-associated, NEW3 domain of alpha-galactosidase